jgi:3-methyladenine DNA glycosylase AlkD
VKTNSELAARIEGTLRKAKNPERAVKEKAYLKSQLTHLGVPVPEVRRAVRSAARVVGTLSHADLLDAVNALWRNEVHELRLAAVELLVCRANELEAADLVRIEELLRESRTWALVDVLAANVCGTLLGRHPGSTRVLDRWAKDQDFWIRRAAMLALLGSLRRGDGDFERFARYADSMLEEKEFFIRKAIGWVLRETSKKRPQLVYEWLAPRVERASGVTIREAVKYLPAKRRARLLKARGQKRRA